MHQSLIKWEKVDVKMFFGEFRHNLDAKGRLTMPADFREDLGSIVYITRGFDGCLSVYNEEEFMKIYKRLTKLRDTQRDSRDYIRLFSSRTKKLEVDKLGRINIPNEFMEMGHLEKACVIIGAISHLEIWDQNRWDQYYEEHEDSYEEIAEKIYTEDDE